MREHKKTTNPPMANTRFRIISKMAAIVHGVSLNARHFGTKKIETQLMYRFQLIIGWLIFIIYYEGRQRSRSWVKVKSNVKCNHNMAPLCYLQPNICLLKHGLRS